MAYKSKKPEQKPDKQSEDEKKKAALDWATYMYDRYQAHKQRKAKNDANG